MTASIRTNVPNALAKSNKTTKYKHRHTRVKCKESVAPEKHRSTEIETKKKENATDSA